MIAVYLLCAVCATADPTLDSNQPYGGRLQLAADVREGTVSAGATRLDDVRIEAAVAWSPLRALELSFVAPYLFRRIDGTLDERTMGDVELRAQLVAWESRGAFGRRRVGLLASLKAPTAPIGYEQRGMPLPSALQPGCGSVAPLLGAYFAASRGMWSERVSASLFMPLSVRDGPHASDSLRVAASVQIQPTNAIAMRLGAFLRVDADGQLGRAADDPNSGGLLADATGELVVSPVRDLLVTAGVFFPILQAFRGKHREGPILALGVGYDF